MGTLQKLGVFTIGLAMLTVATLPESRFAQGLDAGTRFITGILSTAMGKGVR